MIESSLKKLVTKSTWKPRIQWTFPPNWKFIKFPKFIILILIFTFELDSNLLSEDFSPMIGFLPKKSSWLGFFLERFCEGTNLRSITAQRRPYSLMMGMLHPTFLADTLFLFLGLDLEKSYTFLLGRLSH